jgi:hypothetical protein
MPDYEIVEHVHRFAAWAASTAARASPAHRFSVDEGQRIIVAAGLRELLGDPNQLPEISDMDIEHKKWRGRVKTKANTIAPNASFTDGVAAKLINVYLKTGYVTIANRDNPRVGALHPPIDRGLLIKLAETDTDRAEFWRRMRDRGWSNFDNKQYQKVIDKIREKLVTQHEHRLWMIEEHFQGYIN